VGDLALPGAFPDEHSIQVAEPESASNSRRLAVVNCESGGPSPKELLMFFEQSMDLLGIASFDGYFLHLNHRWSEVLGFRLAELKARPFLEFVHADDRPAMMRELSHQTRQGSGTIRFENRFLCSSGHYRWLQWSLRSETGEGLIFASARDVTETMDARSHFQVVVEAAPAGLLIAGGDGRITMVNRQIESSFGYRRDELIGARVEILLPERFRGDHGLKIKEFFASPSVRAIGAGRDLCALRKDGSEFPVEIALNPFTISGTPFVLSTIVDITDRKKQEFDLQGRVQELQRHRHEMENLSRMSSLLQHAISPGEVHEIVASFSVKLLENSKAGIYTLPASGDFLQLAASWGGFSGPGILRVKDCWALRHSRTHHSSKTRVPCCPHTSSAEDEITTCLPMSAHGQLTGLVSIVASANRSRQDPAQVDRMGRAVADQLALSNLELREKLEFLSMRDSLTGLFNRRYLEETVTREMERARRGRAALCILMIDTDHFKKFNDNHGHLAGDDALRRVAKTLTTLTRPSDVCCRYGGEEFVILLPDCSLEEAATRAENLRAEACKDSNGEVTISVGVSEYPRHGLAWGDLLGIADRALYQAKATGRNRVVIASASVLGVESP
jgi:diguanylate cyclase (GGDEF)-like protein/PAS domain S-box-containing protein